MSKVNFVKELLNEKFVLLAEDFSFYMSAPIEFRLFDVFNRVGSRIGDAPGCEIRIPYANAQNKVYLEKIANIYGLSLYSEKDVDGFHIMRFQDNNQIKYFTII